MTGHAEEQEMELEALQAILMDDLEDVEEETASQLNALRPSTSPWHRIVISPKGDDEEEPTEVPVRLALYFSHTKEYPDEKPLLCIKSLQGVKQADVEECQRKLEEEAELNLGMAMVYTLATSAKDWLREKYGNAGEDQQQEDEEEKEEVIEAHGLPVTLESFLEWRERFEAEEALERAKLMPDLALASGKEKRLTGREWFVQRALKGVGVSAGATEGETEEGEEDEEIDFEEDFEDEDIDEDELLDHFLEEKGERF